MIAGYSRRYCKRVLVGPALVMLMAACASEPVQPTPAAEASAPADEAAQPVRPDFEQWLAEFRDRARAAGIDPRVAETALGPAEYLPSVIERDRHQPEFTRAIWDYLDSAVSDSRIGQGRDRLLAIGETAREVERNYGVRKEILAAIWGVESNYGANFGNYAVVDALATLGYDGRRPDFARRELLAALRILQSGDVDRESLRGSWAGALGHPQFLPTSYLEYAVDADGDGRRDIWSTIPDVLASIANYLARAGWREGQPWGVEAVLPQGFDYALAELDTRRTAAEWAALGVRPARGERLPDFQSASVIVPAGARGPAFLVGPNFRAILRYNNATSYALAVGHLADRIAGQPGFRADWPRGLASLSREQVEELQRLLNAHGFDAGTPDGLMGPNTRDALRAYQQSLGLVPDGFATVQLLQRLRGASDGG